MIVTGSVQEVVSALEKPYTMANSPPEPSATPGTSILGRFSWAWLTSRRSATIAVGTAIARLTYRHHRHDRAWVSAPPSSSPRDAPPPAIAPKIPNALGRSGESAKVTVSSDSAEGASSAPKAPCRARAATSTPKDCARPPSAEATEKPIKPAMNVHLRPNRSPSLPPSSSRLPKASA